jgi:hypothetical protein
MNDELFKSNAMQRLPDVTQGDVRASKAPTKQTKKAQHR